MKILLIIGFVASIILVEDLVVWLWGLTVLAHWCSIILPSFLIGTLWKFMTNDDLEDDFRFIIPVILGIVKIALFAKKVSNPTLVGGIFMAIVYTPVSYLLWTVTIFVAARHSP